MRALGLLATSLSQRLDASKIACPCKAGGEGRGLFEFQDVWESSGVYGLGV